MSMGNAKMRKYVMHELIRRTRGRSLRRFQEGRGGEGGATVTPVINAKRANKNLFKGIFVLQVLEVNTIPNSTAKSKYINPGELTKYCIKYVAVT